jgi:CheY-like chemotaxis protein/HPt (histidine-containing phosphotransfer) domain-containing protein
MKLTSIELESVIEKLHALFYQQAFSKQIDFTYEIDTNVPPYILADETRLLQIMANLTSNAIKFTEQGHVKIHASVVSSHKKTKVIKVSIVDTGIGIPKDKLNMLFEDFSQVDTTSTKTYSGTGLGLAISKELTKLMNGQIGVDTHFGEGSTFWFTFETTESKKSNSTEGNKPVWDDSIRFNAEILLVDDNQVNLFVAQRILEKSGCTVITATNGEEAIKKAQDKAFDLILMDIQMPKMDGITATKAIKELLKANTPPIIAMTAYAMKEDQEKFINSGMNDYISKPISADNLLIKIQEWLHKKKTTGKKTEPIQKTVNQVINKEIVSNLLKLADKESIVQIYGEFETELKESLNECTSFYAKEEWIEIQKILHTLKGSAGTLGVSKVENKVREIEQNLKQNIYFEVESDLKTLGAYAKEFYKSYKDFLNKL